MPSHVIISPFPANTGSIYPALSFSLSFPPSLLIWLPSSLSPLFLRFPSCGLRCWCPEMVGKAAMIGHTWDVSGHPGFPSLKAWWYSYMQVQTCASGQHTLLSSLLKSICLWKPCSDVWKQMHRMCVCVCACVCGGDKDKDSQLSIFICFWECWVTIDFYRAKLNSRNTLY